MHNMPVTLHFKNHIFPTYFRLSSSTDFFLFSGTTAQHGPRPPHSGGFWISHTDTPYWVLLLWTTDQPVAETSTWQHTHKTLQETDIHASDGIFFLLSIYPLFYINSVFTSHVVTRNIIGIQPRRNTHLYLIFVLLSSTFYPRYVRCYTDLVGTGPGIRSRHTAVSFRHL